MTENIPAIVFENYPNFDRNAYRSLESLWCSEDCTQALHSIKNSKVTVTDLLSRGRSCPNARDSTNFEIAGIIEDGELEGYDCGFPQATSQILKLPAPSC
jgi:hypothetical protein